jgi:hypothetical protein
MGGGQRGPSIVFVLNDKGAPEPKMLRLGISDGQFVEVRDGIAEGTAVVTGLDIGGARPGARPSGGPSTNPFQPQPFRPQQQRR